MQRNENANDFYVGRRGLGENKQGGLRVMEERCKSRCGNCGAEIHAEQRERKGQTPLVRERVRAY